MHPDYMIAMLTIGFILIFTGAFGLLFLFLELEK